jgi:hypothetical protein
VANENVIMRCSFCSKPSEAVRFLIAGPGVSICDECVGVCADIIAEQKPAPAAATDATPRQDETHEVFCALCRMPTLTTDGLFVEGRGFLCPRCLEEIEVATAAPRQSPQ